MLPFISAIRQGALRQDVESQQSTTTVSGTLSPTFGRDGERDNLINALINEAGGESTCNRTSIPVIAVVGIGGAGKTTMAQAVCNSPRVENHFDMRMRINVSRNFDVRRVTREIIESAGQGGSTCSAISNLDSLQKMLEGIINSKKFLLVLDDIWCEDKGEWDKVLIPLNKVGDIGSRILITTRAEGVALTLGVENKNLVPLKELKAEDCLSILKYYAFNDTSKIIEDRTLADVAEKIAYKLKNSPLAARLVGSSLRKRVNVDAWEMVLKEDIMLSDTLKSILLSFQYLPPHLQRCFAFCSLFPKGHIFSADVIDDLVLIWIAEGFIEVPEHNELTTIEKGRQYFNELVSYSFFQSYPDHPSAYVIHDLLHDLAEKVSKGHCVRIEADDPVYIPPTTVHLSIIEGLPTMLFPDESVLVNLRTLMCIESQINSSLLAVCTKLRVLYCMSRFYRSPSIMPELPRSIGQLKHLRYLQAEQVKELPDSFGRLYHLQFLDLPLHLIERVPKSFSNLVNLQHLLHGDLEHIKIPEIGKLASLQTLRSYRVEMSREFGIGQLKNLYRLRGSLEIEGLENVKDKTEASEASLNKKKHLEELRLKWNRSIRRQGRVDEEVLEGMEPHSNLKKLEISEYRGAKTPSWMRHILPGLQSLRLIDCPNLTGVPRLPDSLNRLEVIHCPELNQLSTFPHSLEYLDIENSAGFEDLFSIFISFKDEEEEEEEQWRLHQQNCGLSQPFALEILIIRDCSFLRGETFNLSLRKLDLLSRLDLWGLPKLTSLLLGPNLKHLRGIGIADCENLQSLEGIGDLPHLEHLQIWDLPELTGVGKLKAFKYLKVVKCPKLRTGAQAGREGAIPDRLPYLDGNVHIDQPMVLAVLLEEQGLNSIVQLKISRCSQDRPFSTEEEDLFLQLTSIKNLHFEYCYKLPSLPANLEKLTSLTSLYIWKCSEMVSLHNLPTSLDHLSIWDCPKMESLEVKFELLSRLELRKLPKLTSLLMAPNLRNLRNIRIENCENLQSLEGIRALPNLKYLEIENCENLQSLEVIGALPHLEHLKIRNLPGVTGMGNLQALKTLNISKCPKLTTGARAGRGRAIADRLPSLKIDEHMLLAVLLEEQGLNSIVILNIIDMY